MTIIILCRQTRTSQKLTQTVFAGSPFLILLKSSLKEGLQVTQ